jgi:hypothetical protein
LIVLEREQCSSLTHVPKSFASFIGLKETDFDSRFFLLDLWYKHL